MRIDLRCRNICVAAGLSFAVLACASRTAMAQTPVAIVPVQGVKVSGAMEIANGQAIIASSGTITAGDATAKVILPGKGELRLCSTTTVHLSRERTGANAVAAPAASSASNPAGVASSRPGEAAAASSPLMIAFDRGALEASFTTGKYSDVLLTPDFRILISGPGQADVRIRVSPQGDTCVENRGANAPYVTVGSQLEDGIYRVQPDQRVLFEHGSLREVVDHEAEPCGCPPPPVSIAAAGPGTVGQQAGTAFPLAQSEGLAPAPAPAPVPSGEVHTQVTVPLAYNGANPAPLTPPAAPQAAAPQAAPAQPAPPPKPPSKNVFHRIGHFFSKMFGKS